MLGYFSQKLFSENSQTKDVKNNVNHTMEKLRPHNCSVIRSKTEDTSNCSSNKKSDEHINSMQSRFNLKSNMLLQLFAYDEINSFI